ALPAASGAGSVERSRIRGPRDLLRQERSPSRGGGGLPQGARTRSAAKPDTCKPCAEPVDPRAVRGGVGGGAAGAGGVGASVRTGDHPPRSAPSRRIGSGAPGADRETPAGRCLPSRGGVRRARRGGPCVRLA